MSIIAPDTTVTLYSDVEISDKEHLVFSTESERNTYFSNHLYKDNVECSYQRIGDPLVLELPISDMYKFNYISFKNQSFENKIIFARTLNPVYINNEVLAIPYVVDDWTTFMFDIDCDECSVVREHITETQKADIDANPYSPTILQDYAFMHTPEPFSPERSVRNKLNARGQTYDTYAPIIDFSGDSSSLYRPHIFMFVSQDIDSSDPTKITSIEPTFLSGMNFLSCVGFYDFPFTQAGATALQAKIEEYNVAGAVSSILGIYVLPYLYGTAFDSNNPITNFRQEISVNIPKTSSTSNKKLEQYPYKYISIVDPMGNEKEYWIERFDNMDEDNNNYIVKFSLFYSFNGQPEIILAPQYYNGFRGDDSILPSAKASYRNANFYEKMVFNQFPQVAYNTDGYLTWLGNTLRGQTLKDTTAAPWAYNDLLYSVGAGFEASGQLASGMGQAAGQTMQGNEIGAAASFGSGFVNYGATLLEQQKRAHEYGLNKALHNAAQEYTNKGMQARIPAFLANANKAFVNNDYHAAGSSSTLTAYMLGRLGFYFKIESLLDGVQYKYDRYMDAYGYNVLDTKIPNIFNIIRGGSWSNLDNPIFCDIDYDLGHAHKSITYVQTVDCNINAKTGKAVPLDSLSNIEAMFNAGHRFIKGVTNNA